MADVQLENGYCRIANEILERTALLKLSSLEHRILLLIWRYTYGFGRKEHEMSTSFIEKGTDSDSRGVRRALKNLEENRIIHQRLEGQKRFLSFNKNYDEWKQESTYGNSTPGNSTPGKNTLGDNTLETPGSSTLSTPGNSTLQERNKEINKKEEEKANPITFYEENGFGLISPLVADEMNFWIDGGRFQEPKLIIQEAMKEAVFNNAKKWNYVNRTLMDWSGKNLKTLDQVRIYIQERNDGKETKVTPIKKKKPGQWGWATFGGL